MLKLIRKVRAASSFDLPAYNTPGTLLKSWTSDRETIPISVQAGVQVGATKTGEEDTLAKQKVTELQSECRRPRRGQRNRGRAQEPERPGRRPIGPRASFQHTAVL